MSNTRGPLRRWRAVAAAALSGLALTACGSLHPGVAAQVGDDTISISRLDQVAQDLCTAVGPQLDSQAQTFPNSYFRSGIATTLVMKSIADQLAAEYDVSVEDNADYVKQLKQVRSRVSSAPEDTRESLLLLNSTQAYVQTVEYEVGKQVLDGKGTTSDFLDAGMDELGKWAASHDVEFAPSLDVAIEDGLPKYQDQAVSYAVSSAARQAQDVNKAATTGDPPNSVLAREMPVAHRCGR